MRTLTTPNGKVFLRKLDGAQPDQKTVRLAVAALLEEKLDIENIQVRHTPAGQPYIEGHASTRISISHCGNLVALYVSDHCAVGVDIELENPRIAKAKSHFINAEEEKLFHPLTLKTLHLIWGAKEAIYKYYEGDFATLENEVTVVRIDAHVIYAETKHGEVACGYTVFDEGGYLVWTK